MENEQKKIPRTYIGTPRPSANFPKEKKNPTAEYYNVAGLTPFTLV